MIVAWTGWVLLGLTFYYNSSCAFAALSKGFANIGKEIVRILGS